MSDPCAPAPNEPAAGEQVSMEHASGEAGSADRPASADRTGSAAQASDAEPREHAPGPIGVPRQRIVRTGRRRAVLTPAPGSDPDPFEPDFSDPDAPAPENSGPNDARMRQDVPPHY